MKEMSRKQLEAVVALKNNDAFRLFLAWVKESRSDATEKSLTTGAEPQRSWMQGRAQELGYLISAVNEAEEVLNAVMAQAAPGSNAGLVF